MDQIIIRGARTHNLKNFDLIIPRDQLVVITGLSGSGKSSLAFDTLYAEGQRRYVESLSAYARQFLSLMEKPDVDQIDGLSPAISIEQKSTSHNPRSTVGTITEIYDYLRLLFARIGSPQCPTHHCILEAQTISQMVDSVLALPEDSRVMLVAPLIKGRKGEHLQLFEQLKVQGFVRVRVDGEIYPLSDVPALDKQRKHSVDVVVDRFKVRPDQQTRIAESFETALNLSDGLAVLVSMDQTFDEQLFSAKFACPHCGYSLKELEPKLFSFNSPAGACQRCDGLGVEQFIDPTLVISDDKLSINEGAIPGWDPKANYYYQLLAATAQHYQFSLDTPFKNLSKKQQQIILYGSGSELISMSYHNERGDIRQRKVPFEGIIPNRERRYRETDSSAMREYLAKFFNQQPCPDCQGARLNLSARHVLIHNQSLPEIVALSIQQCHQFFSELQLEGQKAKIAEKVLKEIRERLQFLINVGLDYLSLSRSADTLSGGEAQRIRLASQIGAGLVGVMYILDEPSIGLHQRDNQRLLNTLNHLRDLGNTVIVVEHDEDAIRSADFVIDIGPGAGVHGGQIVFAGPAADIVSCPESLTGQYLSHQQCIDVPPQRHNHDKGYLTLEGATGNNLCNVSLQLPIGTFTCVTGVSGSGKSTLINETLYKVAARTLNKASVTPAPYQSCSGLDQFDKIIDIDQSPIGRTPRSNPATYTGIFTGIRELFAGVPEARSRGYKVGRFSFNVKGGRCEACQGDGVIKVEMHFLPDVYVPCDICQGKRYNRETLEVEYKGKNIDQVLQMTVEDARSFFDPIPAIARKLQTLMDVGLSYIQLGQAATTLSGGEAQRVKLAKELSKRDTGKTLYILDEPTTGLHFHDIKQLLTVLHRLRDHGNTIVVIEHNLDVIKTADWIIDLGPEGGTGGGNIIAQGTPEQVADCAHSYTGQFLKPLLNTM